jgi:4-hydroxy-3-methylbut-2-en-1-yl diphosphate synthase IspG/GcpE
MCYRLFENAWRQLSLCPTCGRLDVDDFVGIALKSNATLPTPRAAAFNRIMGCAVTGPVKLMIRNFA